MTDFTPLLFNFFNKYKLWIIAFWSILTISCSFFAVAVMNVTVFTIIPPEGSPSRTAYDKMNEYFTQFLFTDTEIIVISTTDAITNINNNITESLCHDLNESLFSMDNGILSSVEYYYQYTQQNISSELLTHIIEPKFIGNNVMLFLITADMRGVSTQKFDDFLNSVQSILSDISANDTYAKYHIHLTGMVRLVPLSPNGSCTLAVFVQMTLIEECMQILTQDVESKDMIMLPIIFVFMIVVVGSYKLVILPFVCFGMVVSISFALFGYLGRNALTVPPEAPSVYNFLFCRTILNVRYVNRWPVSLCCSLQWPSASTMACFC